MVKNLQLHFEICKLPVSHPVAVHILNTSKAGTCSIGRQWLGKKCKVNQTFNKNFFKGDINICLTLQLSYNINLTRCFQCNLLFGMTYQKDAYSHKKNIVNLFFFA